MDPDKGLRTGTDRNLRRGEGVLETATSVGSLRKLEIARAPYRLVGFPRAQVSQVHGGGSFGIHDTPDDYVAGQELSVDFQQGALCLWTKDLRGKVYRIEQPQFRQNGDSFCRLNKWGSSGVSFLTES